MKKSIKLFLLALFMLLPVGCKENNASTTTSSSTAETISSTTTSTTSTSTSTSDKFDNTAATAIDMVAEKMSEALETVITATHDTDGDWIALNFGTDVTLDQLKTYTDTYFIPDKFEAETTSWNTDAFEDGTGCEYKDYVREDILIEYLVYFYEGYGNILQVEAFEVE